MTVDTSRTGDGIVQPAYLHNEHVSHSWHDSMRRLLEHDLEHGRRVARKPLNMHCSTNQLVATRNYAAQLFLDKTDHEWLWFVDTDMGFADDTVDRLLEAADPATRPVVGALCFALHFSGYDGMGGMRTVVTPTLYRIGRDVKTGHETFSYHGDYPPDTVMEVAATGAACLLIHRSVLEKLRAEFGDHWFDQVVAPAGLLGEDFSFCLRLRKIGAKVHVHTGVPTTHHKEVWLGEYEYARAVGAPDVLEQSAEAEASYVPPATDRVAVVVPVMRRPGNAAPFMASLRASTGLATVYAVADHDDPETAQAWRDAGAEVIQFASRDGRPGTFAEKVNAGYRNTAEPWLFCVGDDVRFHPGWYDRARYVADTTGAAVIGVNDLGLHDVRRGEHATHWLIRRDYVDEQGASWDGPGVVCHEGYRHWCIDNEVVTAAKQRGQWAAALDAVVEHLHPFFGKADMDDVYKLGHQNSEQDKALFAARLDANRVDG